MSAPKPRFIRVGTFVWSVAPFVAIMASPPVGPFCIGVQAPGFYWYRALELGAFLMFPVCFAAVIAARYEYSRGRERTARFLMLTPLPAIAVYWFVVVAMRLYWGEAIDCPLVMQVPRG